MQNSSLRVQVILNYLSLISILVVFSEMVTQGLTKVLTASLIITTFLLVLTFVNVQSRTGLWKMTHKKVDQLDEREMQISHEALRLSYSVFSILVLFSMLSVILLSDVMTFFLNTGMVLVVSFIYVAHTLPSSILAWNYSLAEE